MKNIAALVSFSVLLRAADTFNSPPILQSSRIGDVRPRFLTFLRASDENDSSLSALSRWKLPNDFPTFLNQCSIQSFVFLLKSLRDPQTVLWMENFTQPAIGLERVPDNSEPTGGSANSKLLDYHGLAAINMTLFPTWNLYFSQLLEQPIQMHLVESPSKYVPDYELEIKPASLCNRLLAVREQIAREWVKDLDVLSTFGDLILDNYGAYARLKRAGNATKSIRMERPNLMFLDFGPDPESDYSPSPLRKGNFDLLTLLVTQESVHRILNDPPSRPADDKAVKTYLRDFYVSRMLSHFTGRQRYGRADDFVQELLESAPSLQSSSSDEDETTTATTIRTVLIDPIRIAKLLLNVRKQVALEWKERCRNVPKAHMDIKRLQLNLLMGVTPTATPASLPSNVSEME